jgi:hypothetical protein
VLFSTTTEKLSSKPPSTTKSSLIYTKIICKNTPNIFLQRKYSAKLGKERPSPRGGSLGSPPNMAWTSKTSRRRSSTDR